MHQTDCGKRRRLRDGIIKHQGVPSHGSVGSTQTPVNDDPIPTVPNANSESLRHGAQFRNGLLNGPAGSMQSAVGDLSLTLASMNAELVRQDAGVPSAFLFDPNGSQAQQVTQQITSAPATSFGLPLTMNGKSHVPHVQDC